MAGAFAFLFDSRGDGKPLKPIVKAGRHRWRRVSVKAAIAVAICCLGNSAYAASNITAVWANDGEDKVTQEEIRATTNPTDPTVLNSVFSDGQTISQFGAKNEVVAFDLILEAGTNPASNVSVSLSNLTGPSGAVIRSVPRSVGNLFNWTGTEAELFYVRYLQITGLSLSMTQGIGAGEAPTATWVSNPLLPAKMQLPGVYPNLNNEVWTDRPNHDHHYPDIAVPLELVPQFTIAAPGNQGVWVDIYIPKTAVAGQYNGTITVSEGGTVTHQLPVVLTVRKFTLPDTPTAKTMVYADYDDVAQRYTGVRFTNVPSPQDTQTQAVLQNQRLLAHRHKISLIGDDNISEDHPSAAYVPALTGTLFSPAHGYAGPGVRVGNDIYSIGSYGAWQGAWGLPVKSIVWNAGVVTVTTKSAQGWIKGSTLNLTTAGNYPLAYNGAFTCTATGSASFTFPLATYPGTASSLGEVISASEIQRHTNNWETWFEKNSPSTQRFLYLIDESKNFAQTQTWANWMATNPGIGSKLPSMATLDATDAVASVPSLNIPTSVWSVGNPAAWQSAVASLQARTAPGDAFFMYNGWRPGEGTFYTDDDGVALREIPWGQYAAGVSRWLFWQSTYYDDFQNNGSSTALKDLFNNPETFGVSPYAVDDPLFGEQGSPSDNGDGLLFYPGTDMIYPASSYGINGPIASLRLKYWRRGIQDVDYLVLAAATSPSAAAQVNAIVNATVPTVLWEFPVNANGSGTGINVSYTYWNELPPSTTATWSSNPDDWEAQRKALADIIESATP